MNYRIPSVIITNDEWGQDLCLIFEDQLTNPDGGHNESLFPWKWDCETLEDENTEIEEYWPENKLIKGGDGEFYIYDDDGGIEKVS